MSVITMPLDLPIGSFSLEQRSYDMVESSDATGSEAVRLFGPPRWSVAMGSMKDMDLAQASIWEVLCLQLRRGSNHLGVWDPVRVAPRGTMRGLLTLLAAPAAGATSMQLAGAAGTLLAGDWLQIGTGVGSSQLVKVVQNVTAAAGVATVVFEPALRIAFSIGATVTWDRPVFYARPVGSPASWSYQAGNMLQDGFSLDLLESFTP